MSAGCRGRLGRGSGWRHLRGGAPWRALTALALLAMLLPVACRDAPEAGVVTTLQTNADEFEYRIGTPGGSLTYATITEPLTFNLALANDAGSASYLGYLFEGLTEVSWLTDEVEPALAESWKHSADGLTWTFYLRRDVTWHDGAPFTAADVEFTFNRVIYNDDVASNDRAAFTFRFPDPESGEWRRGAHDGDRRGRTTRCSSRCPCPSPPSCARWASRFIRSTSWRRRSTRGPSTRPGGSTPTRRRSSGPGPSRSRNTSPARA